MFEQIIPFLIAAIVVFVGGGIFLKFFVLDPARMRRLFEELKIKGYGTIDPKDTVLTSHIQRLFWEMDRDTTLDIFQAWAHKRNSSIRYICDIHYSYRLVDSGVNMFYTMIAETLPVDIKGDVYIYRKLPRFVQGMFNLLRLGPAPVEVKEGL